MGNGILLKIWMIPSGERVVLDTLVYKIVIGGSLMRWQELKNREIINVDTGERLGLLGDCDIEFDPANGRIKSIIIPEVKGYLSFISEKRTHTISWDKIKKIGSDMVIIEK